MTEADIFERTDGAYLRLIHPKRDGETYCRKTASLITLAPSVSEELVATMLVGASINSIATSRRSRMIRKAAARSSRRTQRFRGFSRVRNSVCAGSKRGKRKSK